MEGNEQEHDEEQEENGGQPEKERVAMRERSPGGAQLEQTACSDGSVTPCTNVKRQRRDGGSAQRHRERSSGSRKPRGRVRTPRRSR